MKGFGGFWGALDAALHHPVLAAAPARAGLVALEDQGGLDLVELLQQSPILRGVCGVCVNGGGGVYVTGVPCNRGGSQTEGPGVTAAVSKAPCSAMVV